MVRKVSTNWQASDTQVGDITIVEPSSTKNVTLNLKTKKKQKKTITDLLDEFPIFSQRKILKKR
jgi:carotenoid cleavage dioxygenase-like enzyme